MVVASPDIRRGWRTAFVIAPAALAVIVVALYLAAWGRTYGVDLHVYRGGVQALVAGHDPYTRHYTRYDLPYTYPPFSLLALAPLAWAPFGLTQIAWWVVCFVALAGVIAVARATAGAGRGPTLLWTSAGWAALAVLVVEPVRSTFDYGQVNTVLMAMVVADLLVVPRSRRGWLVGAAAAVKLTPIVFVVVLALDRDLRSTLRATATFAALSAVAWVAWPSVSAHYWVHQVASPGDIGPLGSASNQSLYGILHRPPFAHLAHADVTALWVVASVAAGAVTLVVARRCLVVDMRLQAVLAVALCGLLISPVSWSHHWVWVVLVPMAVLGPAGRRLSVPVRAGLGVVLLLAVAAPYWWFASGPLADVCMDLMPVWSLALLAAWSASSPVRRPDRRDAAVAVPGG